ASSARLTRRNCGSSIRSSTKVATRDRKSMRQKEVAALPGGIPSFGDLQPRREALVKRGVRVGGEPTRRLRANFGGHGQGSTPRTCAAQPARERRALADRLRRR